MDMGSVEDPNNLRLSALDIECSIMDGGLNLGIVFSRTMFDTPSIERLLDLWALALKPLTSCKAGPVENPLELTSGTTIGDLTSDESLQLLRDSLQPYNVDPLAVADVVPAADIQAAMLLSGLQ